MTEEPPHSTGPAAYRVLARKYRPASFEGLIGQDAMVRTLANAMASGRLAHAFILTGVRGVGKTTTARIIARSLNCIGPDGTGGPTIAPCGVCENCRAIAEDRHVDVIEMDAASRTGIDDIRELIEGVRYRPVSARFKVYIVDEVHMLSKAAFNALLKTLEEPPEHVKFVFATTEIRKVPVTVLSRCQRFDLRRVDTETLARHFARIAELEGVRASAPALALIARAADGSVRDGLSLLDQAIALTQDGIEAESVRAMLGLADRGQVFDLLEALFSGAIAEALAILRRLYDSGADPALILSDLLEAVHWLTRLKIDPALERDITVPETEARRGAALNQALSMAILGRAWQMLLKGLGEVQHAPHPVQAAEMVLIRLAYAADLPSPAELARLAAAGSLPSSGAGGERPASAPPAPAPAVSALRGPGEAPRARGAGTALAFKTEATQPLAATNPAANPTARAESDPLPDPRDFRAAVALFAERREAILHAHLLNNVHLVHFEPGRIEIRLDEHAPAALVSRIGERLSEWTGRRWVVAVSSTGPAQPTLAAESAEAAARLRAEIAKHPLVKAVMDAFPGATLETVRARGETPGAPEPGPDDIAPEGDEAL